MNAVSTMPTEPPLGAWQVWRIFYKHLLSLVFPLNGLAFVLTGPHPDAWGLLFVVPILLCVQLDRFSPPEGRAPDPRTPSWPFDVLLVTLTGLQVANVVLLVVAYANTPLLRIDTLAAMFVVGASSAYSGIVVAHELIHRPNPVMRNLGRLLLSSVLYEHFATEHVRGHHVRIGTAEDPATARFGEGFTRFFLRTVPAQFKSAWQLEKKRLGEAQMSNLDVRMLRHRVLHGLLFGWGIAAVSFALAGPTAFVVFVGQAIHAVRALEVVNYFEHWGLTRSARKVRPVDSWDTHAFFTYYALTGLSRHADHHAYASRPYQQLRVWDDSPKLPSGYLGMFPLVLGRNRKFQKLMTAELERRKLGPFKVEEKAAA